MEVAKGRLVDQAWARDQAVSVCSLCSWSCGVARITWRCWLVSCPGVTSPLTPIRRGGRSAINTSQKHSDDRCCSGKWEYVFSSVVYRFNNSYLPVFLSAVVQSQKKAKQIVHTSSSRLVHGSCWRSGFFPHSHFSAIQLSSLFPNQQNR